MKQIAPVKLHSTTLNQPVFVYPDDVVAITFLDKYKTASLIMVGGASIPVQGTLEEIEATITAAKNAANNNPKEG